MILFVGHEASRTGAPKVLLDFLKWLKINKSEVAAKIVLRKGGERIQDFAELFPTQVWQVPYPKHISLWQRIDNKLFDTFRKNQEKYIRQFENQNVKLIFSNTCTNGELLEELRYLKVPIITFVHELESVIRIFNQNGAVTRNLQLSTHIIVPSEATKNNLIENHQVPPTKISVCYNGIEDNFEKTPRRHDLRQQYQIVPDALIVGACGTADYRKGVDLLIQLAYLFQKKGISDVFFWWAGLITNPIDAYRIEHEIRTLDLKNILFLGKTEYITDFYQAIDLLALTSREEPFGLVSVESGSFQKPVVCFAKAGAASEIIPETDQSFCLAPFLDLENMQEKITFLKENKTIRKQLGENLYQKTKKEFVLSHTLPKIWDTIQKFM